jgi:hypothetical protein
MHEWVTSEPRVAYKDHVHFSDLGYQRWADLLSGALIADYDRWRAAKNLPPGKPFKLPPTPAPQAPEPPPDPEAKTAP